MLFFFLFFLFHCGPARLPDVDHHQLLEKQAAIAKPAMPWYRSSRYLVAFWAFLGFFNVYALRVNLSVAIVDMSKQYNWGNWQSSKMRCVCTSA